MAVGSPIATEAIAWPVCCLIIRVGIPQGYVTRGTVTWLQHSPTSNIRRLANSPVFMLSAPGYRRGSVDILRDSIHQVDHQSRDKRFVNDMLEDLLLSCLEFTISKVINADRICRVTVTIEAIKSIKRKNLSSSFKDLFLKVSCEGKPRTISKIKGTADQEGILAINQSFPFDVKDVKKSALLVQVYKTGIFGTDMLGQCKHILVSDLLKVEEDGLIPLKSKWYDLYSEDGGIGFPGKILMQIGAGMARPEQKLHLFVGTWNVGNAQPFAKVLELSKKNKRSFNLVKRFQKDLEDLPDERERIVQTLCGAAVCKSFGGIDTFSQSNIEEPGQQPL
ncbi:hypothetical protein L7F22_009829 [Adiantum nelumboides]|nr:hypothetical protein [Adiantum nelumboides]